MEPRVEDLRRGVESYLDRLAPPERVNLMRFSYDIEVLLPEFSIAQDALAAMDRRSR
jgi:hypothetical protein